MIILISVIISGIAFAWYIYRQKALAVLVVYLFLLGSIIFVNSVDYAFNNILKSHQKERISILLGLRQILPVQDIMSINPLFRLVQADLPGKVFCMALRQSLNLFLNKAQILFSARLVKSGDLSDRLL